jgi:hypothetical protein
MDKNDLLYDMFDFARLSAIGLDELKNSEGKCEDIISCILPILKQIVSECVDKKEIIKSMYENDSDVIGDVIYKSVHSIAVQIFSVYMIRYKCKYDKDLICEFLTGGITKVLTSYAALKEEYPKDKFVSDIISVCEIIIRSEIFDQNQQ